MPKKQGICKNKGCRKKKAKGRAICHSCKAKKYREDNPVKSAYQNLRYNAKRRKKEFDLTFEQFEKLCVETEYIKKRGKSKDSYSIDRIDPEKGYTIDNIRVISLAENSRKNNKKTMLLNYNWQTGEAKYVEIQTKISFDKKDVPF